MYIWFVSKANVLSILADSHQEWITIVCSFGGRQVAEDIVQDTYLRVHKHTSPEKVLKNNKPNKAFMFVALRNTYLEHCRKASRRKQTSLDKIPELRQTIEDLEEKEAVHKFDKKIKEEQENWHWYDAKLFNLYLETGQSYRDIAKETNISLTSIYNTVSNCKKRLKLNLSEDWQDLQNKDYERI